MNKIKNYLNILKRALNMFYCQFKLLPKILIFFLVVSYSCIVFSNVINSCQSNTSLDQKILIRWPKNEHKKIIDKSFWLTIEQVHNLKKDIDWIDVRPKLAKANNPLNLLSFPLNQLETPFLFDKTVVLVGTGFDELEINNTIKVLREKGFNNFFALLGGIRTWNILKKANLDISEQITPEEFLLGGKTINWQVITIGLTQQEFNILPEKPIRQFNLSEESILELRKFLSYFHTNSDAFIRYVLITPNEQITLALKFKLNLYKSNNIVWLKGGLVNYQHYIQLQTNLINNTGKSLTMPCRLTLT